MRRLLLTAAVLACASGAARAQDEPVRVHLNDRAIHLGDIARLDPQAGERMDERIVATFPGSVDVVKLSEQRRRELVRRQLPLDTPDLRLHGPVVFQAPPRDRLAAERPCHALRTSLAEGEFVTASDVEAVPCRATPAAAPVGYDRQARALRANAILRPGTYLGSAEVTEGRPYAAGTTLTLVTRAGAVELTRDVELVQSARAGTEAFVRTRDGEVFALVLFEAGEER